MELRSTLPASVAAFAAVILCFEAASAERRPEKVDFARDVYPIFERHCLECHGPQRQEDAFSIWLAGGGIKPAA